MTVALTVRTKFQSPQALRASAGSGFRVRVQQSSLAVPKNTWGEGISFLKKPQKTMKPQLNLPLYWLGEGQGGQASESQGLVSA